jgi:hypothetical protein
MEQERRAHRRLLNRVEFILHKAVDDRRLPDGSVSEDDNPEDLAVLSEVHWL